MNLVLSIIAGLIAGAVAFYFGSWVGFPQPLLGFVSFAIFIIVAFFGHRGNWFGRV